MRYQCCLIFKIAMAVMIMMMMVMYWVLMPCKLANHNTSMFRVQDEDSMFLRNFGIYLRVYKAQNPKHHHRQYK
jgi:hypothetical protein